MKIIPTVVLLCLTAPLSSVWAPRAFGQQPQSDQSSLSEVVVSGTRLATNGAESPTPVLQATMTDLQLAAPSNLADGLNQLPSPVIF